jgi:predicted peptidase
MKSKCKLFLIFAMVLVMSIQQMERKAMGHEAHGGGQQSKSFEKTITKNLACKYLLFLPEGYGEKNKKWPLILFLHGAGERGDDLNKVKVHGPPKIVQKKKDFPFIVVSPQCPKDSWWNDKVEVLINLLDEIEANYNVDTKRVYLTGLSMGGYGTWALGSKDPERFAAIAPICGGGMRIMAFGLTDMPIWVFHGAKDKVVPLDESEEMVAAIKARGGNVKLTVYPDAGHDSWTETYNNPKLYEWFLKHRRVKKKK